MPISVDVSHRHIKRYVIGETTSGIVYITFNTHDRWVPYYRFSTKLYGFGEDCDYSMAKALEIQIPEHIDLKNKICSVAQDNDQITFYFMSEDLLEDKE